VTGSGRPVVLFGGKGGVGKTTTAAAYAQHLAGLGHRTLLVSTDPAHSTGDLLGVTPGPDPTPVDEGWWALDVDAEREATRHVERILADAAHVVSADVRPAVERHLRAAATSPGTLESALVDRLAEVLTWVPERFDRVVVDTAPTGHTLRLLALPALLTPWVEGLVRMRERAAGTERMLHHLAGREEGAEDPVVARLRARRDRLAAARQRLLDDAVVHLVLVAERLPVAETERAVATLADADLTVGALVVNRVLPGDGPDGDGAAARFLAGLSADQHAHVHDLEERLPGRRIVTVPHLPHEPRREDLAQLGAHLATALDG
jgi:arsenite/tail-anchored protein-transporting ATPase